MKILVLNGPNINFLGIREKGIYGNQDYDTLVKMIEEKAQELGVEVEVFQSNYEGGLIDRIQKAYFEKADGIIINPGAFTHYSAMRWLRLRIFQRLKSTSPMCIPEKNSVILPLPFRYVTDRL